jgi:hypothetical protein
MGRERFPPLAEEKRTEADGRRWGLVVTEPKYLEQETAR